MNPPRPARILIVGNRGGTNVGECFERAAVAAGHVVSLIESRLSMTAPAWLRAVNWRLRGHRPTRLNRFSHLVARACRSSRPDLLLATGLAPINHQALARIQANGVFTMCFLTDDPWNPAHRAPWFMRALPRYSAVFSPRRANLIDLERAGAAAVRYLPFAYDPGLHYPEPPGADAKVPACDVLFIGGADPDRLPHCRALAEAGVDLALYGDYWDRYPVTRPFFRGYADLPTSRQATGSARVCLLLVRRANRDGHTMRSFEAAAIGGCLLAEDTPEHRDILGRDGDAAVYFRSIAEMVERARWLLGQETERRRLAAAARSRIISAHNTYADRLSTILDVMGRRAASVPEESRR